MDREHFIEGLLRGVKEGEISVTEGVDRLRDFPSISMDHSTLDTHRTLRTGIPEVIYGAGKSPSQILDIVSRLAPVQNILATRVSSDAAELVLSHFPEAVYNDLARTLTLITGPLTMRAGEILILTAGTSDLGVAQEAQVTCTMLGSQARIISDVGVAGIHRLFERMDELRAATATGSPRSLECSPPAPRVSPWSISIMGSAQHVRP